MDFVAVATNELQEGVSSKMMIHPAYRKTAVNHVPVIATRIHTVNRRTEPILLLTFVVVFLLHLPATILVLSHPVNTCIPGRALHTSYQVIVQ